MIFYFNFNLFLKNYVFIFIHNQHHRKLLILISKRLLQHLLLSMTAYQFNHTHVFEKRVKIERHLLSKETKFSKPNRCFSNRRTIAIK